MAVPFGIALLWLGYGIGFLGYARLQGSNATFLQLFWPGKYVNVAQPDGGGGSSGGSTYAPNFNQGPPAGATPSNPNPSQGVPNLPGSQIPGIFNQPSTA